MSFQRTTADGHAFDEVASALQKTIRRGQEREAVYWAMQLESRYRNYLWRRLRIISQEDVGLADPMAAVFVEACYRQYFDMLEAGDLQSLPLVNAVLYLCRAEKTRMADNLLWLTYATDVKYDIPDVALDKHTSAGKRMGRGFRHFVEEGAQVIPENEAINPYKEEAHNLVLRQGLKFRAWYSALRETIRGRKSKETQGSLFGQ